MFDFDQTVYAQYQLTSQRVSKHMSTSYILHGVPVDSFADSYIVLARRAVRGSMGLRGEHRQSVWMKMALRVFGLVVGGMRIHLVLSSMRWGCIVAMGLVFSRAFP
jgi:hypothetical protein